MNSEAINENFLTLRNLLNLTEGESSQVLEASVLISDQQNNIVLQECIKTVLQKTFKCVGFAYSQEQDYGCEIIIENSIPRTSGPYVFVGANKDGQLLISNMNKAQVFPKKLPPFFYFLMSCYIGGAVIKAIVGKNIGVMSDDEICIDPSTLIESAEIFEKEIDLGEAYLAGAGAIGNAFLYALKFFKVKGLLHITDPDLVSAGNLNRCLFFKEADIGNRKAEVLAAYAQPLFPHLKLNALCIELSKTAAAKAGGAWLKKLIVAVDSKRARRNFQSEIPGEVFDASTTGISEVITHYNKQPLSGKACMGCIYYKDVEEQAHEKHIAELLGVSLAQVNQLSVDVKSEIDIKKKYPTLKQSLIGFSYDTLFKQLCGEGQLKTEADKQVLAPLAFVSALAGALLALTLAQNILGNCSYNYWRLSPWNNPNYRLQQVLEKNLHCEFCNREVFQKAAVELWPS